MYQFREIEDLFRHQDGNSHVDRDVLLFGFRDFLDYSSEYSFVYVGKVLEAVVVELLEISHFQVIQGHGLEERRIDDLN
jgi:hypothetical protein